MSQNMLGSYRVISHFKLWLFNFRTMCSNIIYVNLSVYIILAYWHFTHSRPMLETQHCSYFGKKGKRWDFLKSISLKWVHMSITLSKHNTVPGGTSWINSNNAVSSESLKKNFLK